VGTLETTDARNPYRDTAYADLYQMTVGANTSVVIDLKSSAFNTQVYLTSASGTMLAQDNDGGGGTDSRITTILAAGTYYIDVSSASAGALGLYTLSVDIGKKVGGQITSQ